MRYTLNEKLNRIDIVLECGKTIAFVDYAHFGNNYPYFSSLLDNLNF